MEKWPITNKKQAYFFIEINALVPSQNSNYVIIHEPTKCCFRFNHQTMQISQVRCDECNWSMKYILSGCHFASHNGYL